MADHNWAELLRTAGYKVTPAREAVLESIPQMGEHLNPAEILKQGRVRYPALGRATVYRTLELLTSLGIVRPIYIGEAGPAYICTQGGHHHLVCSRCGVMVDFDRCVVDEMAADLHARFGFIITSHLLEFYGFCPACQARGAEPAAVDANMIPQEPCA